jgi:hypothetical protein
MTYHRVCNYNNTTGVTSGAGTANHSGAYFLIHSVDYHLKVIHLYTGITANILCMLFWVCPLAIVYAILCMPFNLLALKNCRVASFYGLSIFIAPAVSYNVYCNACCIYVMYLKTQISNLIRTTVIRHAQSQRRRLESQIIQQFFKASKLKGIHKIAYTIAKGHTQNSIHNT